MPAHVHILKSRLGKHSSEKIFRTLLATLYLEWTFDENFYKSNIAVGAQICCHTCFRQRVSRWEYWQPIANAAQASYDQTANGSHRSERITIACKSRLHHSRTEIKHFRVMPLRCGVNCLSFWSSEGLQYSLTEPLVFFNVMVCLGLFVWMCFKASDVVEWSPLFSKACLQWMFSSPT